MTRDVDLKEKKNGITQTLQELLDMEGSSEEL